MHGRWAAVACLLIGGSCWALGGPLAGGLYGLLFQLDPASPRLLALVLDGGTALLFAAVGFLLGLVSLALSVGVALDKPWALIGARVMAALMFLGGLLPFAIGLWLSLPPLKGRSDPAAKPAPAPPTAAPASR